MNPTAHDGAGRSRWLHELRQRVAEQIEFCHMHLDEVTAALGDEHQGGPIPVEARAFFAAEAAVDLMASTRYLQRASASCGTEMVRRFGDVVFLEQCTRMAAHEGDCDSDATSLMRLAQAAAHSLVRSAMTAADMASLVALRLDQASADGTRQVGLSDLTPLREVAQELSTIADGARVLSDELHRAEAQLGAERPTALDRLAQARSGGSDAASIPPHPALGGHG
jgi:hypothetical protein